MSVHTLEKCSLKGVAAEGESRRGGEGISHEHPHLGQPLLLHLPCPTSRPCPCPTPRLYRPGPYYTSKVLVCGTERAHAVSATSVKPFHRPFPVPLYAPAAHPHT